MHFRLLSALLFIIIHLQSMSSWAQTPSTETPAPKIGPFVLHDEAGHQWRPTFLIQSMSEASILRHSSFDVSVLEIRRLRAGLDVISAHEQVRMDLVLNLAPGSAQLVDAQVALKIYPALTLTLGQFKTPWSRYRLSSGGDQVLVDWSQTTRYFGGERQRGLAFNHGSKDGHGLYMNVGIFVGRNSRRSHGIGVPLVYGQPLPDVSSLVISSESFLPHPEVVGHIGWGSRGMDASTLDDRKGGGARVYLGTGLTHDFNPVLLYDATTRLALETLFKWRGLSGYVGGYVAWVNLTQGSRVVRGLQGALMEMTWRAGRFTSLGFRMSRLVILPSLQDDALRVRSEQDLDLDVETTKDELSLGARFDFYSESFQLMTDLSIERAHGESMVDMSGTARVQLQLRF